MLLQEVDHLLCRLQVSKVACISIISSTSLKEHFSRSTLLNCFFKLRFVLLAICCHVLFGLLDLLLDLRISTLAELTLKSALHCPSEFPLLGNTVSVGLLFIFLSLLLVINFLSSLGLGGKGSLGWWRIGDSFLRLGSGSQSFHSSSGLVKRRYLISLIDVVSIKDLAWPLDKVWRLWKGLSLLPLLLRKFSLESLSLLPQLFTCYSWTNVWFEAILNFWLLWWLLLLPIGILLHGWWHFSLGKCDLCILSDSFASLQLVFFHLFRKD